MRAGRIAGQVDGRLVQRSLLICDSRAGSQTDDVLRRISADIVLRMVMLLTVEYFAVNRADPVRLAAAEHTAAERAGQRTEVILIVLARTVEHFVDLGVAMVFGLGGAVAGETFELAGRRVIEQGDGVVSDLNLAGAVSIDSAGRAAGAAAPKPSAWLLVTRTERIVQTALSEMNRPPPPQCSSVSQALLVM